MGKILIHMVFKDETTQKNVYINLFLADLKVASTEKYVEKIRELYKGLPEEPVWDEDARRFLCETATKYNGYWTISQGIRRTAWRPE